MTFFEELKAWWRDPFRVEDQRQALENYWHALKAREAGERARRQVDELRAQFFRDRMIG